MKTTLMIFILTTLLLGLTSYASAYPANCLLKVHGKTYIKGICEFSPTGGGDFVIKSKVYFAQLRIYDKEQDNNLAELNWNDMRDATHAQARLGDVRRQGACWQNQDATICVQALDATKRAKIESERPNGAILELLTAGYPNVCTLDNSFQIGTPLIIGYSNCNGKYGNAPKLFKRSIDNILIDQHPMLCIDTKPSNQTNVSELMLADCKKVSNKWTFFMGVIHSTSKNLCWQPAEYNEQDPKPMTILAIPCHRNMKKNAHFNLLKSK